MPRIVELYFDGVRVAVWSEGFLVFTKNLPRNYTPLLIELVYDGILVLVTFDGKVIQNVFEAQYGNS